MDNDLKRTLKGLGIGLFRVIVLLIMVVGPITPTVFADIPEEQPGSRAAGLCYSVTSLTDAWSLFHNQAGLGFQENPWVGVHHENRFISPDLSFSAIGGVIPVKPGALGIGIKRLGFSQFSQTKLGLAYGMKLAPTLSAGIQLNGHHLFFAGEYGSTTTFSAELGIIYTPAENLNVGMHVVNPTRSKLHENERLPTVVNLGISYQLSNMLMVTGGAEKNIDAAFTFKAGIEFLPINDFYIRAGMSTNPSQLGFGMGYRVAPIQIDFAFSYHEYLGYTPHFSLSYTFGYNRKNIAKDETP